MVEKQMHKNSEKKTVLAFVIIDKSGHLVSTAFFHNVIGDLSTALLTPTSGPLRSAGNRP